jgi:hypothetical protein
MTKNNATAAKDALGARAAGAVNGHGGQDLTALRNALAAEFPRGQISWRAQSVSNKNPDQPKALALAYIDARDVMNRLDDVVGVGGWQDRYEVFGSKTICHLSLLIDGQWVTKADGAGDSDIEAEKGALSDAFKRAAVKWGIGRYLYDIASPWVPCELYNGKWSRWTVDPWSLVREQPKKPVAEPPVFTNSALRNKFCDNVIKAFTAATTQAELDELAKLYKVNFDQMSAGSEHDVLAVAELRKQYSVAKIRLAEADKTAAAGIRELEGKPADDWADDEIPAYLSKQS